MKKLLWLLPLCLVLCGCGADETLETVADEWLAPAMAQPREVSVRLPEDAAAPVLEQDSGQLYMAEGYEIMLETLSAGDLNATVRALSGYDEEQLTIIQTRQGDADRYDFVWTTAGEKGQRLGRGAILDDGSYHYCLSALRDDKKTTVVWKDVFSSFVLI